MTQTTDQMELREDEVRKHYPAALAMLQGIDHAPRVAKATAAAPAERSPGVASATGFRSTVPGLTTRRVLRTEGVQVLSRIEAVTEGLVGPVAGAVQTALRRAIAIALALGDQFAARTALADLKRANLNGALPPDKRTEFSELLTAEALAVLYTFANATAFLLAAHATEETVEIGAVEEVLTDNSQLALHGAIWELDQDLASFATTEPRLVATVLAYMETLMARVAARAEGAARLAPFTDAAWHVKGDDFPIRGFQPAVKGRGPALTMTFKKPDEVIGNHIAKYQAMRLAKMIMAYDFGRKLNPFVEMGGFIFTFMGDGAPGTGKTTLIQMMAGLIHDYCQIAGYQFRYQNLSTDNIDSYQGKSGQNARAFINNIIDPGVIGFGTVDDIDMLAGKRGDRQSSAGQLEITAVLMDAFAGANTVVRGNCTFGMFSNYPENVDDALRQRAGARFLVDGPQSKEDYIDILALLLGKKHDIPVGDHALFANQEIKRAVSESFASHGRPKEDGLIKVWDQTETALGKLDTIAKIGTYLKAIQGADKRFTGRAIKNITDAVKVRAMDFELPDDWFAQPDHFLFKTYDEKRDMISALRQPITVDMVIQEVNRYADSEFRYADKSDEEAIGKMVREFGLTEEAKRRYIAAKGA